MRIIILLIVCIFSNVSFSQTCEKVWLNGKIVDSLNPASFLNIMVVNVSVGKGVFGQADGTFGVYVKNNDSIVVSVKNYERFSFRVVADSSCKMEVNFAVYAKLQDIGVVVIKPLKTIQQIKEERSKIAMHETKTVTGAEVFQSPITALYEHFSKEGKSKQKVAELRYLDSQEEIIKELLRLYVSYDIVKLNSDEFSDFIQFMAMDVDFLKTASDAELISFIKDKFEHYLLLHPKE